MRAHKTNRIVEEKRQINIMRDKVSTHTVPAKAL